MGGDRRAPETAVTVFVNTVDSYGDCWRPFFDLLAAHWPDCPQPVVLNTERATFAHDRIRVRCTRTSADVPADQQLPWGERLARGLASVDTEYVLYLFEDAFFESAVDVDVLDHHVALVDAHGLDCLRLVEPDGAGPYRPTDIPGVWEVDQQATYLAMLQAAVWRTDVLRSLVVPAENPWQFEKRGGRRIRERGLRIHTVDRDRHWRDPATRILPYHPTTGIVMGRWREDVVVDLFARHGIDVDLSVRGSEPGDQPRSGLQRLADRVKGKLRELR